MADQGGQPEEGITSGSKTGRISKAGRTRRKWREPPFTERQLELLRARTTEHKELKKMTWLGLCDAIFDHCQGRVWINEDDLQQWATKFIEKRRKTSRHPTDEGFQALAAYLTDPEIAALLPEELEDPGPPYRFLHSLREIHRSDPNSPLPPPPSDLQGLYEAWHQVENPDESEEQWIKTSLRLEIDDQNRFVRATERWEIHFRGGDEAPMPSGELPSEGYGIVIPEEGLFLLMKTKPYERRFYYLPVGTSSQYLALLRHEPPNNRGLPGTFAELSEQMKKRTLLLNFHKVGKQAKTETGA